MQFKTILNRVERHKSFVYGAVRFCDADASALEVEVQERANGRPICSACGQTAPGCVRAVIEADLDGWEPDVYRVFGKAFPTNFIDWQDRCAAYLARRKYRIRETLARLVRQLRGKKGQWHLPSALLVLHFDLKVGKEIVRDSLQSPHEMERSRLWPCCPRYDQPGRRHCYERPRMRRSFQ